METSEQTCSELQSLHSFLFLNRHIVISVNTKQIMRIKEHFSSSPLLTNVEISIEISVFLSRSENENTHCFSSHIIRTANGLTVR